MDPHSYDTLKRTVVRIRCKYTGETEVEGETVEAEITLLSAGVVFDSKGYVLTAAHCVPSGREEDMEVSYFTSEFVDTDSGEFEKAIVKKLDRNHELAILVPLNHSNDSFVAAKLSEDTNVRVFQKVYSITHPLCLYYTESAGSVSHVSRGLTSKNGLFLQICGLDSQQGSSGGPVFDEHDNIVSIISVSKGEQCFAVHPATVRSFIEEFYRELREEEEEAMNKAKDEEQRRTNDEKQGKKGSKTFKRVCNSSKSACREQQHGGKAIRIWYTKLCTSMFVLFSQLFSVSHSGLITAGQFNIATGIAGYQDIVPHLNTTLQFTAGGVSECVGGYTEGSVSPVLGWSAINQNTSTVAEVGKRSRRSRNMNYVDIQTQFVKVKIDGLEIGRKVDLSAHTCYETLAQTLKDMFVNELATSTKFIRAKESCMLLDESSEFLLAYEDNDGEWMLVGDVPWGMFLASVQRLRIIRRGRALEVYP